MLPTLHYAPVSLSPVRFRPLALGSAILALALFLLTIEPFTWFTRHFLAPPFTLTYLSVKWSAITFTLSDLAVFSAVPLLAKALPAQNRPWKTPACIFLAGAYLLSHAATNAVYLAQTYLPTAIFLPGTWGGFTDTVDLLSTFLTLALFLVARAFLLHAAARIRSKYVGILASVAFLPAIVSAAFLGTLLLARPLLFPDDPDILYLPPVYNVVTVAKFFIFAWLALIWLALALFAALLAFKQPR